MEKHLRFGEEGARVTSLQSEGRVDAGGDEWRSVKDEWRLWREVEARNRMLGASRDTQRTSGGRRKYKEVRMKACGDLWS